MPGSCRLGSAWFFLPGPLVTIMPTLTPLSIRGQGPRVDLVDGLRLVHLVPCVGQDTCCGRISTCNPPPPAHPCSARHKQQGIKEFFPCRITGSRPLEYRNVQPNLDMSWLTFNSSPHYFHSRSFLNPYSPNCFI
ncbi:uncharacterized protein EI90DRAFT_3064164 [Cantharellus anzutake]|uniref:uncharacterized protein n=1 Tax=Cantharellus anzutake TaxID=1750568 RepID=UPI001907ED5E|nr:uncharacterized protein EI90DRAFT_3064164 [Cantharellus anzutake]KAF8328662.1 hypothetical protein EI90DRAFT_3064164 [Cantharellus anzutake]